MAGCATGVRTVPAAAAAAEHEHRLRGSGLRGRVRGRCVQRCSEAPGARRAGLAIGRVHVAWSRTMATPPRVPRPPRYAILAASGRLSTVALQPCVATLPARRYSRRSIFASDNSELATLTSANKSGKCISDVTGIPSSQQLTTLLAAAAVSDRLVIPGLAAAGHHQSSKAYLFV